jgi:hypothetical protein
MLEWAVDNWKWLTGPVLLAVLWALTADRGKRREGEVEAWRAARTPKKGESAKGKPGAKKIAKLPEDMAQLVDDVGGGAPVASFELAPKLAYLTVAQSDALSGSDHATVVAKLEKALVFTARPLPVAEGNRGSAVGIEFKKDPEFTEQFLVEGADSGAVKKWLVAPVRQAMLDLPDVWLTVRGKLMALSIFGPADAERIEALVAVADAMFGEHGAGGAPSLVGEPQDDEDDDEEEDDDAGADEADGEGDDEGEASAAPAEKPRVVVVKAGGGAKPQPKSTQKKTG